jgi:tetratricopeptide (TPR) repeat protein
LAAFQGDFGAGRIFHEQALLIGKAIGDGASIASALLGLGKVAQFQREYGRATTLLEEGLALDVELVGWRRGWMLFFLGVVVNAQSEYERATALFEESLALFREVQERVGIAEVLHSLGLVAWRQSDYERAAALFAESLALFRELGDRRGIPWAILDLGWVALQQDADERAAGLFEESMVLFRELGDRHGVAYCLDGWSAVAAARGLAERALRLGGAAESLRAALNTPLSANERIDIEHSVAALRAQLDQATFAAAWAAGRAMTLEQAIAEALDY